jgi:hypothetical protein
MGRYSTVVLRHLQISSPSEWRATSGVRLPAQHCRTLLHHLYTLEKILMKPINEMTVLEVLDELEEAEPGVKIYTDRLRELHEQPRWVPVSERMPTMEDADSNGSVLWWSLIGHSGAAVVWKWDTSPEYHGKIVRTHWKHIQAPERRDPIKDHVDRYEPHVILYMETRESDLMCTGVIYNDLVDAHNDALKLYGKGYANVGAYLWNEKLKQSKEIKNKPEET